VLLTKDKIPKSKHGIAVQRERARQSTPAHHFLKDFLGGLFLLGGFSRVAFATGSPLTF